ncbi:MAG: S8 family serine peptidase [bacterium]
MKKNKYKAITTLSFCSVVFSLIAISLVSALPHQYSLSHQQLIAKASVNGKVRVIVQLKAKDLTVKGLSSLKAELASSEDSFIATLPLEQQRTAKKFKNLPLVEIEIDKATLEKTLANNNVQNIQEDRISKPLLADSIPLIQANEAWASGFTGQGQAIAILDTGIDKNHPFLNGKTVSEACYSTTSSDSQNNPISQSICPNGQDVDTSTGSGNNCTIANCDHGSHVAGIAVGNGVNFSGVAKDASLISIQVYSKFSDPYCSSSGVASPCVLIYDSDLVSALDRVYELRSSFNIAAVNMSLGGSLYTNQNLCDSDNSIIKTAIDQLKSAGIATIAASGNGGSTTGLTYPACISSAISVGASTKNDLVANFTDRSTFLDLLAPGASINSSLPGGTFGSKSGTSMAAPHVAGAWAILKQKSPAASVSAILTALTNSGTIISDPSTGLTFPRINLQAALNILEVATATPTSTTTATVTATATLTPTTTWTSTATNTNTSTPTSTKTATTSATATNTITATPTKTVTQTPTVTTTVTRTATRTNTTTTTLSSTPSATSTSTNTITVSITATNTFSPTKTFTASSTFTVTRTKTPTETPSTTVTATNTQPLLNSPTFTATKTLTNTSTAESSNTPTSTFTQTPTITASNTPTPYVEGGKGVGSRGCGYACSIRRTATAFATSSIISNTSELIGIRSMDLTPTEIIADNTKPIQNFFAKDYTASWLNQTQPPDGKTCFSVEKNTKVTITVQFQNIGQTRWLSGKNYQSNSKNECTMAIYKDTSAEKIKFAPSAPPSTGYDNPLSLQYGQSYFYDPSTWLSLFRIGTIATALIQPNETASFPLQFQIPASAEPGRYREDFSLACGAYWVENPVNGDPQNIAHIWTCFDIN